MSTRILVKLIVTLVILIAASVVLYLDFHFQLSVNTLFVTPILLLLVWIPRW